MQDNINSCKPAKRTLLLTIDISKAFDAIPRYLLIKKIYNTKLHNDTKIWLANYLSGRQSYVHYSGKSSKTLNIPNGVLQGSVLSPTLFNLYMHDIPASRKHTHSIIRRPHHDHIHTQ
ncbi:Reverse transcriptase domain [Trinorchestia longiramus]|nr:Reverse transcriptase domain [Trinorchestia longiramus]